MGYQAQQTISLCLVSTDHPKEFYGEPKDSGSGATGQGSSEFDTTCDTP
jgi:hypothetical protein